MNLLLSAPGASRRRATRRLARDNDLQGSHRPHFSTNALPGTEEKVRVMMARVAAGEAPFHPDDARLEDAPGEGFDYEVQPNGAVLWLRAIAEREAV